MKTSTALAASMLAVSLFAAAPGAQASTTGSLTESGTTITYPVQGRGSWSSKGVGGTLTYDGKLTGPYYRVSTAVLPRTGSAASAAVRSGTAVSIDDYAVHRAVMAVQAALREQGYTGRTGLPLPTTGVWGLDSDAAMKKFQTAKGLPNEGVMGKRTSMALFGPLVTQAASDVDYAHRAELERIMRGTIGWESGWDPGAVGGKTPHDIGLGQINGLAHPSMSVEARLDPKRALPYVAGMIKSNLIAFEYRLDEAVAAYNLGQGGARRWVAAGKPQYFPLGSTNDVHRYIDGILNSV